MLSFSQQSVFLSLGQYHSWWIISPRGYHSPSSQCFQCSWWIISLSLGQYHSWWIISPRGYHSPSSQCFYHWVNTTLGGLLVPEGIILPVVSVPITGSIPLLGIISPRGYHSPSSQCCSWWIIGLRGYHSPSSQCFYHWVNTTLGGLLVPEGIILPVVSVSITGSIPLLVDYQSPRCIILPVVSVSITGSIQHSWWIISPRGYHSPSSQCFHHWVNTTLGGLLVPEGIILPVVRVSITGSTPLLVDYQSPRVSFSQQSVFLSHGSTPLLVDYYSPRLSFSQQSVFLSLGQYHSWWIISPRRYHSPSSQCFYHWVNTTLGGLLVPEVNILPVVSVSITGSIPLGGLLVPEGIILPVVSVSITGSIQLLVDYQSPRVSFSQQSVFLSLGQYHSWWIISL